MSRSTRKADLQMSSRNNRLSPFERQIAPRIYRALEHGYQLKKSGSSVDEVRLRVVYEIEANEILKVEYSSVSWT